MSLMDFANEYDKALERRREAEECAEFENTHENPILMSQYVIEAQMAQEYTLNVFLEFQKELVDNWHYSIERIGGEDVMKHWICLEDKHDKKVNDIGDLVHCVSVLNQEVRHLKKEVHTLKEADRRRGLEQIDIKRNQGSDTFVMMVSREFNLYDVATWEIFYDECSLTRPTLLAATATLQAEEEENT
ncbi:hypothetical protein ACLOJK_000068 [Asimina triloba]